MFHFAVEGLKSFPAFLRLGQPRFTVSVAKLDVEGFKIISRKLTVVSVFLNNPDHQFATNLLICVFTNLNFNLSQLF